MNYKRSDFEIMAPVGSRESLSAAIQAGANSIYFGIEHLNMRAHSASAFSINDLREIAEICDSIGTAEATIKGTTLTLPPQTSVVVN